MGNEPLGTPIYASSGTYRLLAKLTAELGWTAVQVRDLTRGGYKEQVRGYTRDTRCRSKIPDQERTPAGSPLA
jgi:hypothetical protein